MGVQSRIVIWHPDEAQATAGANAAFDRIQRIEEAASDYMEASEIRRLGPLAGTPQGAEVSTDLFSLFSAAHRVSAATDGAFDVTVGPCVALWRAARDTSILPSPELLAQARARVGWRQVAILPLSRIRYARADLSVDFGGIAKGYAVDQGVATLRALGLPRCLVTLSGDVGVGDPPPGQHGWRIAVQHSRGATIGVLLARNQCVSTSGDSAQAVEIDGVRYSHIVDPRSGLGATAGRAATVVSPHGEIADALATALCLLDLEARVRAVRELSPCGAILTRSSGEPEVIDPHGMIRWSRGNEAEATSHR